MFSNENNHCETEIVFVFMLPPVFTDNFQRGCSGLLPTCALRSTRRAGGGLSALLHPKERCTGQSPSLPSFKTLAPQSLLRVQSALENTKTTRKTWAWAPLQFPWLKLEASSPTPKCFEFELVPCASPELEGWWDRLMFLSLVFLSFKIKPIKRSSSED